MSKNYTFLAAYYCVVVVSTFKLIFLISEKITIFIQRMQQRCRPTIQYMIATTSILHTDDGDH